MYEYCIVYIVQFSNIFYTSLAVFYSLYSVGIALLQVLLPQLLVSLLERSQRGELESLAAQYARAGAVNRDMGEERDDRRERVAVTVRMRVEWQRRLLHYVEDLTKGTVRCTTLQV